MNEKLKEYEILGEALRKERQDKAKETQKIINEVLIKLISIKKGEVENKKNLLAQFIEVLGLESGKNEKQIFKL